MLDQESISNVLEQKEVGLTRYLGWIAGAIREGFPIPVWVRAEISSINIRGKGYATIGLIELDPRGTKTADTTALVWNQNIDRVIHRFRRETGESLKAGMRVLVQVSAALSPQWGFRLNIEDIDVSWSVGEAEQRLKAIREELAAVWQNNKKLEVPQDFTSVLVIAPVGAGVEDFMKEAGVIESWGICRFVVRTCTFEGPNASASISSALQQVNEGEFDAIFIVRGGGAASSLAWLNDRAIVQEVCTCLVPVIAAVGHERDHTLLDEVACLSIGTPSKAVGWLVGTLVERSNEINELWQLSADLVERFCDRKQQECLMLKDSGLESASRALDRAEQEIQALAREGMGLGPHATFERGYVLVASDEGEILRSHKQVNKHERVWLMFNDGSVAASGIKDSEVEN